MIPHEIQCHISDVAVGWWEWFLTTIADVDSTEFIAVGNRSHNRLKLFSGSLNVLSFDQTGHYGDERLTPDTPGSDLTLNESGI
jgi:hypothetical protein